MGSTSDQNRETQPEPARSDKLADRIYARIGLVDVDVLLAASRRDLEDRPSWSEQPDLRATE